MSVSWHSPALRTVRKHSDGFLFRGLANLSVIRIWICGIIGLTIVLTEETTKVI
jgi:hypothetical protein